MEKWKWINALKNRWGITKTSKVLLVLLVFCLTGFTVMYLKSPTMTYIAGNQLYGSLYSVLYYIFILPVYNILLLGYGFLFGQFKFFLAFEKKMIHRIIGKK